MLRLAVLGILALALMESAAAQPMWRNELDTDDVAWFYNKPGVSMEQIAEDTSECELFGRAVVGDAPGRAFQSHGLVGAILAGANMAAPIRTAADDCMIARHYRRFTAPDRNYAAFAARYNLMSNEDRTALASSETPPEGVIARRWGNDYWSVDATRKVDRPPLVLRPGSADDATLMHQVNRVNLGTPIALGPDQALIIFSIEPHGDGARGGVVRFTRDDKDTGGPGLVRTRPNGQPTRWPIIQTVHRARAPAEFGYVVPAGFYSFAGVWTLGGFLVDFCMGTAAFNVEPGAVLHLGNYVIERGNPRINAFYGAPGTGVRIDPVDLDAARTRLAASPDLAVRLAPVSYQNGFVRGCLPNMNYGFDVPGAPWMETGEQ